MSWLKGLSILLLSILLEASCSFKNPADKKSTQMHSEVQVSNLQDSDGDKLTDLEEKENGSNPFIADLPTFDGEFFEEMKLTTYLHNPRTYKFESASFQVRKNLVSENGTPREERDFLSSGSQFLIEQNNLMAKRAAFKASFQTGDYTVDDIGYYAPPRMNDLQIFPYSERISELSKTHDFEEMEFFISNRLNFKFKRASTYTDLVFDLYWYNDIKHEFILIGTDFLSGIYQFNTDSTIPLSFKTNDKELVRLISLSGGRFLYLKLRDFKIIEMDKFYKQILSSIKEKSIPVVFFDGEKELIQYVGTNGRPAGLKNILSIAVPEEVQIYNSKIVRIGQKSEKTELTRNPYGESGISQYRFQLLTNEITNSPFSYSFNPGDILAISYVSSTDPYGLIPSYFGSKITSTDQRDIKTLKIMSSSFSDLSLNLRPGNVTYTSSTPSLSIPCGNASNTKLCWKYQKELITLKGIQGLPISGIIIIKINDKEFRLHDLLNTKDAVFRIKNSQVIQIKFKNSLLRKIPDSNGLTISFSIKPLLKLSCEGLKICESSNDSCAKLLNNPPACEDSGQFNSYSIIDKTMKSWSPVIGEAFFSIEYI